MSCHCSVGASGRANATRSRCSWHSLCTSTCTKWNSSTMYKLSVSQDTAPQCRIWQQDSNKSALRDIGNPGPLAGSFTWLSLAYIDLRSCGRRSAALCHTGCIQPGATVTISRCRTCKMQAVLIVLSWYNCRTSASSDILVVAVTVMGDRTITEPYI